MDDGLRKFSKLLTLSNRRSTIQFDQNLKANKTSSSKNKDSPELENLFKRRKNIKRKKEILDNKDLDNDYIDILAKFMSSSEHRTIPKIVTIDRKIFKKVPKKEDENIDNLIELLTEKFQKADFKDEKLEKPQILDQADEIINELDEIFTPLLNCDKFEFVETNGDLIKNIEVNILQLERFKKESLNFGAKLKFSNSTVVKMEKILSCADQLLEDHVNFFSTTQNTKHSEIRSKNLNLVLTKQLFDVKYMLSYFQNRFKSQPIKRMIKKFEQDNIRFANNFTKTLPKDINEILFVEKMFRAVKFGKDLLLSVDKSYHYYYKGPLIEILKYYKFRFEEIKLVLTNKETKKTFSLSVKIYNLLKLSSWKTKKQKKSFYSELEPFLLKPGLILKNHIARDQKILVNDISNKIVKLEVVQKNIFENDVSPKKVILEGKRIQKEFNRLTEYALDIVSNYKKSIFSENTLQIFSKNTLALYKLLINSFLNFDLSDNMDYINFYINFSPRKEKKQLKNVEKFLKKNKNLNLEKLLAIASTIFVAKESIDSLLALLDLEFENLNTSKRVGQTIMPEKFEKIVLFIGYKTIFNDLSDCTDILYQRNNKKLILYSSLKKEYETTFKIIENIVDRCAFVKIMESCFLALMKAIEYKFFNGEAYFLQNENDILRKDIHLIYKYFQKFNLDPALDEIESVCAVKEFLIFSAQNPQKVIEIAEKGDFSFISETEYYRYLTDPDLRTSSPHYSDETKSLTEIGLLKMLQHLGNRTCADFLKVNKKKMDLAYFYSTKPAEFEEFELLENLTKLPFFEGKNKFSEMFLSGDLQEDKFFRVSIIYENQKLSNHNWIRSNKNPPPFTDKNFKTAISLEQIPDSKETFKWRWATEWLSIDKEWAYSTKFSSKKFKIVQQNFLHKARTRKLIRYRVADTIDFYDEKETNEVLRCIRTLIATICWGIYKKTSFEKDEKVSEFSGKSRLSLVEMKSDLNKFERPFLKDTKIADELTKALSVALAATSFDQNKKNFTSLSEINMKIFSKLEKWFKEIYSSGESIEPIKSITNLKEMTKICIEIAKFNKLNNILAFEMVISLFSFIFIVSETDDTNPLISLALMQSDAVNEGADNIYKLGLPYLEIQSMIITILETMTLEDDSREWQRYIRERGIEKAEQIFDQIEEWLSYYHSKNEGVDEFEETVCKMMETYYYLGKIISKFSNNKIDTLQNLRRIMQQSIKTKLKREEKEMPKDVLEWEKKDWIKYTKNIKIILMTEVDKYQNDIFIPGFNNPCKNTIIPILSNTLKICETALLKNELNSNFLAVIKFYSDIESLIGEWAQNDYFSPKLIESMRHFVPAVEDKIKLLLKYIVNSQFGLVSTWITASKENEKLLENGHFTSFYSDALSYMSDFGELFLDLLKQLPPANVNAKICQHFRDAFQQLVILFADTNIEDVVTVDEIISKSKILNINKNKNGKYSNCRINVFQSSFEELVIDKNDDDEYEIDPIRILCCKYSNLCLGKERIKSFEDSFIKKVRNFTNNPDFTIVLNPISYQDRIDEIASVLAHRVVYTDLGDCLFNGEHYRRQSDKNLIRTNFNKIDEILENVFRDISSFVHIGKTVLPIFQAVFDVYVSAILWLLLGSKIHNFEKNDIKEIEADFEIFDNFKFENEPVVIDTFEMKSLKLILSYFGKNPSEIIDFHRAIFKKEKNPNWTKSEKLFKASQYVRNPCTACYLDTLEERLEVSSEGLLSIIEHLRDKSAADYLKQFLKRHKSVLKKKKTSADIEIVMRKIMKDFEKIQKIFGMSDFRKEDFSVINVKKNLAILADLQNEKQNDEALNWSVYLSDKRIINETENIYKKCLYYCEDIYNRHRAESHSQIICVLLEITTRFGFLLNKIGRLPDYNNEIAQSIIEASAKSKFTKIRKLLPKNLFQFKKKDWDILETEVPRFIGVEISCYSVSNESFGGKHVSGKAIYSFLKPLCVELCSFLDNVDRLKSSDGVVEACRLLKATNDYVRASAGPEQFNGNLDFDGNNDFEKNTNGKKIVSPIGFQYYQKIMNVLPNYDEALKKLLRKNFQIEFEKAFTKLKSVVSDPKFAEKAGENINRHSKYCAVFEKMLISYKKRALTTLSQIPIGIHPSGTDFIFFEYLAKFIDSFFELNFPNSNLVEQFKTALLKSEKDYNENGGFFVDKFVSSLQKLSSSKIDKSDDCLSIKFICDRLENLRFVNTFLPKFKNQLFEDIEKIGMDWTLSDQNIAAEIYVQIEKLLKLSGFCFVVFSFGESLFGNLFRKRSFESKSLLKEIPLALQSLKGDLNELDFAFVFDSIFGAFVESFEFLLLDSERLFSRENSATMSETISDLVEAFTNDNKRLLKDRKLKALYQTVQKFSNSPEENIRLHKKLKRSNHKKQFDEAANLLKIIAHTDSKESQRYAIANENKTNSN